MYLEYSVWFKLSKIMVFVLETYYDEMLECDVLDVKDEYDFKDKLCQSEKKKLKLDVSCITKY